MSQQTLETALENIRLFEKCYYPGFRNAWQILPEIQAYQLNRKLLKRYKKKGLERIGKSHRGNGNSACQGVSFGRKACWKKDDSRKGC